MTDSTVHHLHEYHPAVNTEQVRVKLIKNTKGYGWEISAGGATVGEAMALIDQAEERLVHTYGQAAEEI